MRSSTHLVVSATVTIALLPIIVDQFSKEIARWHVAAAANAIILNEGDADYHLEKVRQWSDDASLMQDFDRFRLVNALQHASPEDAFGLLKTAIAETPSLRSAGLRFSEKLLRDGKFQEALDVLELSWSEEGDKSIDALNHRAYLRALAVRDLDEALQDIDQALLLLAQEPVVPGARSALLDTRAWVLFQMGRPLEGLSDINKSIKLLEHAESSNWLEQALAWLSEPKPQPAAEDQPQSADPQAEDLLSRDANPLLWNKGVRYYHRAKILEALGRTEEAERDFEWLKRRRLPIDHRLY